MDGLFRTEVMQAQRGRWLGTINLASPLSFAWWTCLAVSLATAIVLFLVFGQYTRREIVSGQLLPGAGLLTLTSQTTGTVVSSLVHEGQRVRAGQPLVEVSANLVSASGDTYRQIATQLGAQEAQVRASLDGLQLQAEPQIQDLRRRIRLLQN